MRKDDDYLNIVGGTTRSTIWEFNFDSYDPNDIWWENRNYECQSHIAFNDSSSSQINLCSYPILGDWDWIFESSLASRSSNGINSKAEIIQFNKEKIVIYEKDYSSDTENYFILERVD